jgi:phytanoyl-CoA hydroxylase
MGLPSSGPTPEQAAAFRERGYLIVPSVLSAAFVDAVNARTDACFRGEFECHGNYPDEWYWREELCKPDVTRHMCNAWKADRTIAALVLNEALAGFAARLMGWDDGARLGNDSVWVKPPGAGQPVSYHTDLWYIAKPSACTSWVTLTDVDADSGTLEYIPGSHKWPSSTAIPRGEFHVAGGDYRSAAYGVAAALGIPRSTLEFVKVEAPAGSVVFHHAGMMHGSDRNRRADRFRRSMGVHHIPAASTHGPADGYIYGRYKRLGEAAMDESFFPVLWTPAGYRSPSVAAHLAGTPYA